MLVITTATVAGYPIKRYIGIVSGRTISGVNASKDLAAEFQDIASGWPASYLCVISTVAALSPAATMGGRYGLPAYFSL